MKTAILRFSAFFHGFRQNSVIHEITARCNLACRHCYNVWKDPSPCSREELPPDQLRRLLARVLAMSRCRHYTFTGGEPTLRADLEDLVALARTRCDGVNLITNGTNLPENRVKSLIAAGVSLFELPLDGGDAQTHDAAVGQVGAFRAMTRAAADIRFHGAGLAFVFVATKQNIGEWKQALEIGIALGARGFLFNRYNAGGAAHTDPAALMPSPAELREALAIAEDYASRYGISISASIVMPPCLINHRDYPHIGFGFCAAGTDRSYYTVDPLGHLRPCNHSPTILGNLFQTPMHQLVRNQTMKNFRAAHPKFCDPCALVEKCQGGCKAAAEACAGDLCACEPFLALNLSEAKPRI